MEAFSLLKYWRSGVVGGLSSSNNTTTILSAVPQPEYNATESDSNEDNDDGPFFDLEFTVPEEAEEDGDHQNPIHNHRHCGCQEEDEDNIEECQGEREFELVQVEDLCFKGKLLNVEEEDEDEDEDEEEEEALEPNPKPHHLNSSLFKSATKFRVFMSALKKSKSSSNFSDSDSVPPNPESSHKKQGERKFFTVKFNKVGEEISIKSLFTRDNSSKGNSDNKDLSSSAEEKQRFSKEAMQKYLKMVKPLYVRVSRRYGDKLSFSGHLNDKAAPPPEKEEKKQAPVKVEGGEGGGTNSSKSQKVGAGLRVVCKHLGKSRSASSAVEAVTPATSLSSKRRDDSLLQQQDGIQGAILHCKKSFNASRECQSPKLPRCVSEPLHEISSCELSRNEGKDQRL